MIVCIYYANKRQVTWANLGKTKVTGSSKAFGEMPKLNLNFRILSNYKIISAVKKQ